VIALWLGGQSNDGRVAASEPVGADDSRHATADDVFLTDWPVNPSMGLPRRVGEFIGRHRDLASLRTIAGRAAAHPTVVTIHGLPGTGTSTLAMRLARDVGLKYPDGLLYVDLKGASSTPLDSLTALGRLMRGLGLRSVDLPPDPIGMVRQYRDELQHRRMVVVLDNAASESQVRPLLPTSPGSLVLITSRIPLPGLLGSYPHPLGVMSEKESIALLATFAGDGVRGRRHADEAGQVAALCGYLPLALAIAGAVLRRRPGMAIADLRARLYEQRLGAVTSDNPDVRASFEVSYHELQPEQQTLLRRLVLLPDPTFGAGAAAALVDGDETHAATLDTLAREQLLHRVGEGRYGFHDLLGQFANEKLLLEAPADRQAAHERALQFYLEEAMARSVHLDASVLELGVAGVPAPSATLSEQVAALEWLEQERATLVTASRQAAQIQAHGVTWRLAAALVPFFELRGHRMDWAETQEAALTAARASGDLLAQAWTHLGSGHLRGLGESPDQADCHLEETLEMATAGDWPRIQARALYLMGRVRHDRGKRDSALARYQRAATLFADEDMRAEQANTILSMAAALEEQREIATEQLVWMGDAVLRALSRVPEDYWTVRTIGRICEHLGRVEANRGNLERADAYASRSRDAFRRIGFRHGQGRASRDLGRILLDRHRGTGAGDLLVRSTALFDESTALFRTTGDRHSEGEALQLAGTALARRGDKVAADLRLQDARAAIPAIPALTVEPL